ncbi:MAG: hypothetical protein O0X96_05745 [Methanocorpusculum sp.]|nr:hypothetical protein [Methanocorpusculum sp.]MDE2524614.1 hypothetical protein [Methanocorpusculum sp.]
MTEPLTPEELGKLTSLLEQAQADRDAQYVGTSAPPPEPMASEILMRLISGQDEIPPELTKEFPHLAAIFQQYMPVFTKRDMAIWKIRARQSLTMYKLCNPHSGMTLYEETKLNYFTNILLAKAQNGYERNCSISTFTTITHQQQQIRMPSGDEKKSGFIDRIKNTFGGRK